MVRGVERSSPSQFEHVEEIKEPSETNGSMLENVGKPGIPVSRPQKGTFGGEEFQSASERMLASVRDGEPVPVVSQTRVTHQVRDILPWMENMYESGMLVISDNHERFIDFIEQADLAPEQKAELKKIAGEQKDLVLLKLKKELQFIKDHPGKLLSTRLSATQKNEVESYKEVSRSIEKNVHQLIIEFGENVLIESRLIDDLPEALLEDFVSGVQRNAKDMEGVKRFEIIHQDPMWDPDHTTERFMAYDNLKVVSSFQAAGPGYSSQAPRNRASDNAYAANFHRTKLAVSEPGSDEGEVVMDATRSAITVEFDQKDTSERKEVNKKLVKQVLDVQTSNNLKKLSWKELAEYQNPDTPVTVSTQTVNLLTTDRLRSYAAKHPKMVDRAKSVFKSALKNLSGAPADDERTLALENLETHRGFDGQVEPYIVENDQGEQMTIYVKHDVRYFNIPNNVIQEKVPDSLTFSSELQKVNNESWGKMGNDAQFQVEQLDKKVSELEDKITEEESELLGEYLQLHYEKQELRKKECDRVLKSRKVGADRVGMKEWQKKADELAKLHLGLRSNPHASQEFKQLLRVLEMRENVMDLYLDTKELYEGGIGKDVKKMDNNRSALATRIIALGVMLEDVEVHFGCRSGKDRTGLVDIELKLLFTEAKLNGRIPSYWEQERMEGIVDHREKMTLESGNVFDLVKANMGASVGLNTSGAASKPLENNEASGKQYQEFTDNAQAFAKLATRPPAKSMVHACHRDKYNSIIQL